MAVGQFQSKSAMGLNFSRRTAREASFQAAAGAVLLLDVGDVLEDLGGSPALLGREGDEVVELRQLAASSPRARRRCAEVAHSWGLLLLVAGAGEVVVGVEAVGAGTTWSRTRGSSGSTRGCGTGFSPRRAGAGRGCGRRTGRGRRRAGAPRRARRRARRGRRGRAGGADGWWCRRDARRGGRPSRGTPARAGRRRRGGFARDARVRGAFRSASPSRWRSVLDLPAALLASARDGRPRSSPSSTRTSRSDATSSQGLSDMRVGDRVVVAVEADVGRLAGAQGLDGVAVERMRRQRQEDEASPRRARRRRCACRGRRGPGARGRRARSTRRAGR